MERGVRNNRATGQGKGMIGFLARFWELLLIKQSPSLNVCDIGLAIGLFFYEKVRRKT
ncbi:hypothetical protein KCTCHS21_45940 [Cohnella abietis]|uniref:Uncharacterized protein n=1 Tax=Cohnella abietis TaxID=2507935 RepID=A0A3T1DB08_9BACL|nr:hypothetical protein KCTCHS21_45940 [Cohnella abietis]